MALSNYSVNKDLRFLILISAVLVIIGCIFIYSASSFYALERFGNAHYFLFRQIFGVFIGITLLFCIQWIPVRILHKSIPLLFAITFILTSLTLVPFCSRTVHGASRWVNLFGICFQPSEFLKYITIMYIAYLLSKKETISVYTLRTYIPSFIIVILTTLLVLKQPDFGCAVTIAVTVLGMVFLFYIRGKDLLTLAGIGMAASGMLIFMKAYRLRRILIFLNPWKDPKGAGFQIIQSLIAIGSGGLFGIGIGHSKQKFFYLPMQHTDFIFSVIAEETGFVGSTIVITLYCLVLYYGLRMAYHIQNTFASLCIAGFSILMSLQAVINLAVVSGLLPTKGIGLPLVSYGNTALICNIMMIGIMILFVRSYETIHTH